MSAAGVCPICGARDGFHDEDAHANRPLPEGKALPLEGAVQPCRACGEPINRPGEPGCRYPNHGAIDALVARTRERSQRAAAAHARRREAAS